MHSSQRGRSGSMLMGPCRASPKRQHQTDSRHSPRGPKPESDITCLVDTTAKSSSSDTSSVGHRLRSRNLLVLAAKHSSRTYQYLNAQRHFPRHLLPDPYYACPVTVTSLAHSAGSRADAHRQSICRAFGRASSAVDSSATYRRQPSAKSC